MDLANLLKLPHAKSSRATPKSAIASLPATAPPSLKSVKDPKHARPTGRPTREERKLEKRTAAIASVDDLLENKPSKSKIREFLRNRVATLLEERGVATMS